MGSNRQGHPRLEPGAVAGRAKVGYLRGLVELCPHAVAHKVPHHGAAVGLHILPHRVGDVKDAVE